MKPNIGLADKEREGVVKILNTVLADEYVLNTKTKNYLVADHEALIRALRVDLETCADRYHDIGTNDFLTGLMEKHEKMAWMLRAYVEGKSV